MLDIYQVYDKSIELMRKGESRQTAIFHALQYDYEYAHNAEGMLYHWHAFKTPPFVLKGGYPIVKE